MIKKITFMLPKNKYHLCLNKSILKISGSDRFKFLQGMVSNDLSILNDSNSIYCAFLTPQGKFLYDFYIINHKNFYYLECLKKKEKEIIKKFQLYKLRAEVNFIKMHDMVSILINNDLKKTFDQNKIENLFYFPDPRNKNFFLKGFCQKSSIKSLQKRLPLLFENRKVELSEVIDYVKNNSDATKLGQALKDSEDLLNTNYRLMQLEDVEISGHAKESIMNIVHADISRLNKRKFEQMVLEDNINGIFKNPSLWLRESFLPLDNIIGQ